MLFGSDRAAMRRTFALAWEKRVQGRPAEPLEVRIADVIAMHPEYHAMLIDPQSLEQDFEPGAGAVNPFLHMGMHLALLEQRASDRPPGVARILEVLERGAGDAHDAAHSAMECLGQSLWEAQRSGTLPDESRYLECLRARAGVRHR